MENLFLEFQNIVGDFLSVIKIERAMCMNGKTSN